MTAAMIMPVLPQEDPKELEDRTRQAISAMQPRNPLELDLVRRAVRLLGEIDRAERVGTAHLAHRVRMATRSGPKTVKAKEIKKVPELGDKLFFKDAIELGYPTSSADDEPAVIVRRLEESAEGCRWLLARWAELLNVVDREAAWRDPEIIRFVRLEGKRSIEAHFDEELNSLFHAFDALGNRSGHRLWRDRRVGLPLGYKGGFRDVPYREIAAPPSGKNEALILIWSVIKRHVGRLQVLLAEQMANARLTDDGDQTADDRCEVKVGGCDEGRSCELTPEGSMGQIVGQDSDLVIDDPTNDKIGILSHDGTVAADRMCQGDGDGRCLPDDVTTRDKAPNKANLELKQDLELQELPSQTAGAEGRKQSQSSKGKTTKQPRSREGLQAGMGTGLLPRHPVRMAGASPDDPRMAQRRGLEAVAERATAVTCDPIDRGYRLGFHDAAAPELGMARNLHGYRQAEKSKQLQGVSSWR